MDPDGTFTTGIAPGHESALLAALLLPAAIWIGLRVMRARARQGDGWAVAFLARVERAPVALRWTSVLLLTTGVVHLALPLGHGHDPLLRLLFLASGAHYVYFSFAALGDRPWRWRAALLLLANIIAYLVVAGSGWLEEADQVGIATKLVELTALGLVMIPAFAPHRGRWRRLARPAASLAVVGLTFATGTVIWVGSFVAHDRAHPSLVDGQHHHDFAARAQAGIIMRESSEAATPEQASAAAQLARATRDAIAKYEDMQAAIGDGYMPDSPSLGLERHFTNGAHQDDDRVMDPTRPEQLVYAIDGNRHVLLGAVFQMERAGRPGPEVGGPITRWHAHNVCVTVLPPAFGLVSPFGTCPVLSVATTGPEMIHVWTVDYPKGPYAEHLDEGFVKELLARAR